MYCFTEHIFKSKLHLMHVMVGELQHLDKYMQYHGHNILLKTILDVIMKMKFINDCLVPF